MKYLIALCLILITISCQVKPDYELVWADEFNNSGMPDSSKWGYDTEGNKWAWGNNELQHYTDAHSENAYVNNGVLVIAANIDSTVSVPYSSARLVSKGKGDWLYGRIEVRAKVPGGKGAWPAIWMLPTNNEYGSWPNSGEIDIMEHVGYEPDSIFFTVHTEAYNHISKTQKSKALCVKDAETAFHVYAIDWTANKIDFIIDEKKVFTFRKRNNDSKKWPFDKHFYLVLNVAIGGNWGGLHGVDDSIFPCQMEIDYVRVYQEK
ncbi:glycoside hydrolase family 16 protein [Carboxylicivirga sp. N1Y90]|uniref:glycoside hydrolase family 16 protein n=1 Tax=Carboxylicivirga fragile TaxID=3417571 RepID=UPI003D3318A5|nr:glycoside hydrolase family 16 protein [Marinilabiliaceae bacterium N1Y90]